MSEGLHSFTPEQFLLLYIMLMVLAAALSWSIAIFLRSAGLVREVSDADELAILARGRRRFGETAITRLLKNRIITLNPSNTFSLYRPGLAQSGVDVALANATPCNWKALLKAAKPYAEQTEHSLIADGLIMGGPSFALLRLLVILPFLALTVFCGSRLMMDLAQDRPVGLLTLLLVVTFGAALVRYRAADRRTNAGIAIIKQMKKENQRLRRWPTADELPQAVALFGTVALVGSSFDRVHKTRDPASRLGWLIAGADGGQGGGGFGS